MQIDCIKFCQNSLSEIDEYKLEEQEHNMKRQDPTEHLHIKKANKRVAQPIQVTINPHG